MKPLNKIKLKTLTLRARALVEITDQPVFLKR
jgi:hypothetical protein